MPEFELTLPNTKTFDALDQIIQSNAEPPLRAMAIIVRDLADTVITLSRILVAQNNGITATRNSDDVGSS